MDNIWSDQNLINTLLENKVVVMPTDTIYGIVGLAQNKEVVERIYTIRGRNPEKPCIILIGDIKELEKFSINLSAEQKLILEKYWFTLSGVEGPGPISIILDCPDDSLEYLHRGTKTLAFRLPAPESLCNLLLKVGPLIAPSANTEALPPCKDIAEAKKQFGNSVDLYIDGGELKGKASKIIKLEKNGAITVLRE